MSPLGFRGVRHASKGNCTIYYYRLHTLLARVIAGPQIRTVQSKLRVVKEIDIAGADRFGSPLHLNSQGENNNDKLLRRANFALHLILHYL